MIELWHLNKLVYLFLPDWQDTQGDDNFYRYRGKRQYCSLYCALNLLFSCPIIFSRNNINRYLILFFPYFLGINICAFIYAFLLSKKFVKRWGALEVLDQNATSASNDETNCKLQAKRKGANNFSVTLEHVISSLSWDELWHSTISIYKRFSLMTSHRSWCGYMLFRDLKTWLKIVCSQAMSFYLDLQTSVGF